MSNYFARRWATMLATLLICSATLRPCRADPAAPPQLAPGASDITFTERSPLSSKAELAKRLNLKLSDMGDDYDLSKCPYKIYIPKSFDSTKPIGVLVYLGYKDSVSAPTTWTDLLDKSNLIFITPVCHSGDQFPPVVPAWQSIGLALDAVHNLELQATIDTHRVYLMSWKSETQASIGISDFFTGFVLVGDPTYFRNILLPNGTSYIPATSGFDAPAPSMLKKANQRPYVLLADTAQDSIDAENTKMGAMKQDGFANVQVDSVSLKDDIHYPNLTTDWFEQKVLPFLDNASATGTDSTEQLLADSPNQTSTAAPAANTSAPVALTAGESDITFTDRSPLSSKKELAKRLGADVEDLGADYDLSKQPYKIYVPKNFDPAQPVGVLVFLGYKDSTCTPPTWRDLLDKADLIFITPTCHYGKQYLPQVPLWQTAGLALDAVYNLQHSAMIDPHRVYLVAFDDGTPVFFALADVFTGYVGCNDLSYFKNIYLPDRSYFQADFKQPSGRIYDMAQQRPIYILGDPGNSNLQLATTKASIMQQDGFKYVQASEASLDNDLHYPNLTTDWFENKALPFLETNSATGEPSDLNTLAQAPKPTPSPVAQDASSVANPDAAPIDPKSAAPQDAQQLLTNAKLLISNGRPDLARPKLQKIIDTYPDDPAATEAKQLLSQIPAEDQ